MEGMMAGKDALAYIPLAEGANERSGGKVKTWVQKWWRTKNGRDWLGTPLLEVTKDVMFELRKVEGARLWMPPRQRWRR